ncbi:hypothetical protein ACFXKC_45645 [Streptomyces sp. NPDC059340]|uniref:hypothetical protein n=1 Tax=Streptomyces sp. NPDC059340 TaxID=3346806 RepID=UPI0036980BC6
MRTRTTAVAVIAAAVLVSGCAVIGGDDGPDDTTVLCSNLETSVKVLDKTGRMPQPGGQLWKQVTGAAERIDERGVGYPGMPSDARIAFNSTDTVEVKKTLGRLKLYCLRHGVLVD